MTPMFLIDDCEINGGELLTKVGFMKQMLYEIFFLGENVCT